MAQKFEFNSPPRTNSWIMPTQPYAVYFTFTPAVSHTITSVKILVFRSGNPLTFTVRCTATDAAHKPTGADLKSVVIDPTPISNAAFVLHEFVFPSSLLVVAGTEYAIIMSQTTGGPGNRVSPGIDDNIMTYPGIMGFTLNGVNWSIHPTDEGFVSDNIGPLFEIWGNNLTTIPVVETDPATEIS